MGWIKVSAKSVAEALMEAAIELGTSSDNIEYHVIEQGSSGLFGFIGAKKAVIEAKKKKTDEELMKEVFGDMDESPKKGFQEEVRRESKREARKDGREVSEKRGTVISKEAAKAVRESRREPAREEKSSEVPAAERTSRETQVRTESQEPSRQAGKEKESSKEGGRNAKNSRRNQKRPRDGEMSQKKKETQAQNENTAEKPLVKEEADKAPKTQREPADPEVVKKRAETFLNDVFRTMNLEVQIEMSFEEDSLSINITGEEMGILIGKRGQTLDSLQYLTSLVVNKGNAAYVRVKLDTEDYRNRRKATLENLAKNIALKVKKTRRPVFLEPMNPYERRIIHSALQNDPFVTTHSEGEEPCRKVVVTLRKGGERYERSRAGGAGNGNQQ